MKSVCFVLRTDLFHPWPIIRAIKEIEVLKENGFEITVISWIKEDSKLPETEEKNGIKLHRFFLPPPQKSFLKRVLAYRKLSRDISQNIQNLKPDAVVCHDLEMLQPGVKAVKPLKVPLFYDAHENWPEMVSQNSKLEGRVFAWMEKRLLKHVTHSYTYGNDLTEKFKEMGFPATTLYNSKSMDSVPEIDDSEIMKIKKQYGFVEDDFIIGFAGSVSLTNGAQQTIDTLTKLPKNIKFFVVGGGGRSEDLEDVKKYAIKKKVEDRVVLTGRVSSDVLLKYTAAFDLGAALFQPLSANEVARVPNKIFDYMALGVPMIVSDFPNMRKIVVRDSDCGLAVDPMKIEDITKAILHFYQNPKEAKEKGRKGKTMFGKRYCWDMQKKKLLKSHPIWRGEV
jgi:glycosyltransferase involved in cell wall biosynthesis